jgi:putative ABC transport system permease protein
MLWRDLWHLRGQISAAALVVACGVAAFVASWSTYQSLVYSQATYYHAFRFADIFIQVKRAPQSVAARIQEIPGVATVYPRVVRDITLDVPGLEEPATGRLVSIPGKQRPTLNDLYIRRGRYPEPDNPDEVLVSEALATANQLSVGDRLGAILNGRWRQLRIAGVALSPEYVYEVGGASIFPDNKRFGVLWMSREVMGPAFNMEGAFNDVALTLAPAATEADVIQRLDLLLAKYGGLGAYGREDQISHHFLTDEIAQNRITATYVPALFLGVAAFLLHIVLSRLVSRQRNEIALLKAFGYRNRTVGMHYLKLALVGASAGALLGTAAGWYLGTMFIQLYKDYYHFPELFYKASPELAGLAVLISFSAAGIGALSAVARAVALPPAEAMRPEPPAHFHAGILERTGVQRWLSPSTRMILRNIARRRWKAFLSVLGIALAVGILVVGRFFFDAINYLMEVQFEFVHRDDVTVTFTNPLSANARFALRRLPGVLLAEPFRAVPVRLRFNHRSRRLQLTGLYPEAELQRLIDRNLKTLPLPPEGLLLTHKLAELLGVSLGDHMTIEVLEGSRPVRQLPVVGLVDELIGLSAYLDIHALNRLMRESDTISGAKLAVDPLATPQLYAVLKRTPAVEGVAVREAMLTALQDLLAQGMKISTTINIVFACVIAFGMVYNGTRIALSERGHELASLRVLGFTPREVAAILLGEQAVLTLAAIPFGFALGYGLCAFLSQRLAGELYRIPLVVSGETFVFAFLVVALAALLSGLLVARRLNRLDLIAVLKTRE